MQGKVTLEDHFATEATLGHSANRSAPMSGPSCGIASWTSRKAPAPDGRNRRRDHDRVPQCAGHPGHPRRQTRRRGGAPGDRCAGGRGRQASRPLCRRRRPADAGSGDRDPGAATLHPGARIQRRIGQRLHRARRLRWAAPLRLAAVSAILARARTPRCPILPASAAAHGGRLAALRGASLAVRADLELRRGNLAARHAADRQWLVRRLPAAPGDHSRPSRRGAAVLSVAH